MIPDSSTASPQQESGDLRPSVSNLVLRDGLTFLALTTAALLLFAGTSLLFRSFTTRRDELAREFAAQGRQALAQHQAAAAIEDLRASLEYGPEDRTSHLLLAEALAEGNHTDEAMNYFAGLRETDPADGFINYQLARLYRKTSSTERAVDAYRAATLGIWEGDGVAKRLQVQLEFADYLIDLGRMGQARAELLDAISNAPVSVDIAIRLGDAFRRAGDPNDALASYQKALHLDPDNFDALAKAGRLAYDSRQYDEAHRLLQLAVRKQPEAPQAKELARLISDAARLSELSLSRTLPARQLEDHLRVALGIAKARLSACIAHSPADTVGGAPQASHTNDALALLAARWKQELPQNLRSALDDDSTQDRMTQLIFDTETQTAKTCGTPTGDDALLLQLANAPSGSQEKPE